MHGGVDVCTAEVAECVRHSVSWRWTGVCRCVVQACGPGHHLNVLFNLIALAVNRCLPLCCGPGRRLNVLFHLIVVLAVNRCLPLYCGSGHPQPRGAAQVGPQVAPRRAASATDQWPPHQPPPENLHRPARRCAVRASKKSGNIFRVGVFCSC